MATEPEPNQDDINVRIIKAVECFPLLYKGNASIPERQAVWQKISEKLDIPEAIVKSRWHILCAYLQRFLEKRRNPDEGQKDEDGLYCNEFRYERAMGFLLPALNARIESAAAERACKKEEPASANETTDLTDPEFVITEKDLEIATKAVTSSINDQYVFYDVETLDDDEEAQQYLEQQSMYEPGDDVAAYEQNNKQEQQEIYHEMNGVVIEEFDGSENIFVQGIIIDGDALMNGDVEEIVLNEGDVLQMDDQIETVFEEIVADTPGINEIQLHSQSANSFEGIQQTVFIDDGATHNIVSVPIDSASGHQFSKMMHENDTELPSPHCLISSSSASSEVTAPLESPPQLQQQQKQQPQKQRKQKQKEQKQPEQLQTAQSAPSFTPENSVMTRRRRAVVLKATPRVQVELTDDAAANTVSSMEVQTETAAVAAANAEASECSVSAITANATVTDHDTQQNTQHQSIAPPLPLPKQKQEEEPQQQQPELHERHHQYQQQRQPPPQAQHQRTRKQRRSQHERIDSSSDHDHRSNDSNHVSTTAAVESEEDTHSRTNDRSEDTIFGELVTAMLKTMPNDRKRAIKKSIMDLLLT